MSVILAIDQSLARPGFAVIETQGEKMPKILEICSIKHPKNLTPTERRIIMTDLAQTLVVKYTVDMVVMERVRTFSKGFISTRSIIVLSSLMTSVIDRLYKYDVPVWSSDTRAWKAAILGNASSTKEDAVEFAKQLGYETNHDEADALCIALYACRSDAKLKEES